MYKYINSLNVSLIKNNLAYLDEESSNENIIKMMESNDFDIIGIKNNSKDLIGYVNCKDIKEYNSDKSIYPIKPDDLITEHTSLIRLLSQFKKNEMEFLFVLCDDCELGIVNHSDLMKQPVKMLLFSLLANFEDELTKLILDEDINDIEKIYLQKAYEEKESLKICNAEELGTSKLVECLKTYIIQKEKKNNLTFIDCLYFVDKHKICRKYKLFDLNKHKINGLKSFRNDIVHGRDFINSKEYNLFEILNIIYEFN